MIYSADFETTTIAPASVWVWGICEIENIDNFIYGENIEEFINFFKFHNDNVNTAYFHNMKFDGSFIIDFLLKNGYIWKEKNSVCGENNFTTIIDGTGKFYLIDIYFECIGKNKRHVKIYDSMKLMNFSVEKISKSFNLKQLKGKIDYDRHNTACEITKEEIEYLKNDVQIVAGGLSQLFKIIPNKMTIGSSALTDYKNYIKYKTNMKWENLFPELETDIDNFIRQSYKGGFTAVNEEYQNKEAAEGIVLDVNSLYPWVLHECLLPYGDPVYFSGKYNEKCKIKYPLYVQCFSCEFKIKENYIPILQIKHNAFRYNQTEYLKESNGETTLTLTNVDMELFFEHYDVKVIEWFDGYMFKGSNLLFKEWIDKYYKMKEQATIEKNEGKRTISKLMQNSLYGKFGLNPIVKSKEPYLEDNKVKYRNIKYICTDESGEPLQNELGEFIETDKAHRKPIYIPIAAFVTAHARYKTISTSQKIHMDSIKNFGESRWIYCDTDSMHLKGFELPENIEIHDTKLGAWALENCFERGKFLQAKRYIEDWLIFPNGINTNKNIYSQCLKNSYGEPYTKLNVTCAGLQKQFHKEVTFENFKFGKTYSKLIPKTVEGGIILENTEFTLKEKA